MRLQHWLVEIRYVPGEDNGLADALSREERRRWETDSKDIYPSGVGGCGGGLPKKNARVGNHNGSTRDEDQQTKEQ